MAPAWPSRSGCATSAWPSSRFGRNETARRAPERARRGRFRISKLSPGKAQIGRKVIGRSRCSARARHPGGSRGHAIQLGAARCSSVQLGAARMSGRTKGRALRSAANPSGGAQNNARRGLAIAASSAPIFCGRRWRSSGATCAEGGRCLHNNPAPNWPQIGSLALSLRAQSKRHEAAQLAPICGLQSRKCSQMISRSRASCAQGARGDT